MRASGRQGCRRWRVRIWLLAVLLALPPAPLQAEDIDRGAIRRQEQELMSFSSVELINYGNIPVNYIIRPKDGTWAQYSIPAGQSMTITCEGCRTDLFEIKINTNGKEVHYLLSTQQRFSIYWNAAAERWDMHTLQE